MELGKCVAPISSAFRQDIGQKFKYTSVFKLAISSKQLSHVAKKVGIYIGRFGKGATGVGNVKDIAATPCLDS